MRVSERKASAREHTLSDRQQIIVASQTRTLIPLSQSSRISTCINLCYPFLLLSFALFDHERGTLYRKAFDIYNKLIDESVCSTDGTFGKQFVRHTDSHVILNCTTFTTL